MDYFIYLNNNNEKVKLDLTNNIDLRQCNIDNEYLNQLILKIDNGDDILQDKELTLLNKILNKADKEIEAGTNVKILGNAELQSLNKKIEDGKIILPKPETVNERHPEISGYIEQSYDIADYAQLRDNPKFFEQQYKKMENKLREKYPDDKYDIEISNSGRGYAYNVYPKNNEKPATLSQTTNIIRSDGIELEMNDYFQGDVLNDENTGKLEFQSASFGRFFITDENGNKHELSYHMSDGIGKDVVDCRRIQKSVAEFFANLPKEKLNEIIEHNIKDIYIESYFGDYTDDIKEKIQAAIDKDGYYISDIPEYGDSISITSPKFSPPKRKYEKETNISRDDNYQIKLADTSEYASNLEVVKPNGEKFNIEIEGYFESDKYHQWQLPKLREIMSKLPESVLEDMSNEIDSIKLMDKYNVAGNGIYALGSNTIGFKADYDDNTPTISFVHELGHAIDNQNGTMYSRTPKFLNKFNEMQELMKKLNITGNHATDSSEEYFASAYAFSQMPDDDSLNNHIAILNSKFEKFKDSDNPDEKRLYEVNQELQNDANEFVRRIRKQPKSVRLDNTIKDFVRQECKDLIDEMNQYSESYNLIGQSALLEFTQTLSLDDEHFEKTIKYYERMSDPNEKDAPIYEEVRELYGKIAQRLQELRGQVKG